ncbi:spore germination protein [Terrilactibacillus sp. BCM23-1]|uniref:Spore germination protein n=1 Tax=Terrilactibacillus tamarindi TaxID=2599694 RepID=A0A6N8CMS4_9BACI|nr:spore germination protein [Terrilactibacillus tamarindi]MTT31231.1 spore germination protein [Terrilactibacillus tamarindi]
MTTVTKKTPVYNRLKDNVDYLKSRLDIGPHNFDVGNRDLKLMGKDLSIFYSNSLVETQIVVALIQNMYFMATSHHGTRNVFDLLKTHVTHEQVSEVKSLDEVVDKMLSGLIIVFIDGESVGIVVDTRHYPGRTPEEPDVEKVIRGSKDGFTENIIENAGLLRRRIRDERYRNELLQVGERSKTDVCISYLKDVVNPDLLKSVREEIKKINVDGIPMADKSIEEFILKQGWNPYPMVRYTGRPDVAAAHLLEGHIIIITDTSPSAIIIPVTLFHHVQHAEEYRQVVAVGAVTRWIRFIAIFTSVFLLPLWILLVQHHLLPDNLNFIGPNKHDYHLPLLLQIILAELGIEILRMAAVHTPTALSTALGLIAAVLIGQIAIQVGIFLPEVILYAAVAAIGGYATPSYELGVANKITRLILTVLASVFGVPGFVIGVTVFIVYLARVQNLNIPYLWPLIPFNPTGFYNIMIRRAMPTARIRPSILKPQDKYRMPKPDNS